MSKSIKSVKVEKFGILLIISIIILIVGFILLLSGAYENNDVMIYIGFALMSLPTIGWYQVAKINSR